jgi:hypothetical protein
MYGEAPPKMSPEIRFSISLCSPGVFFTKAECTAS